MFWCNLRTTSCLIYVDWISTVWSMVKHLFKVYSNPFLMKPRFWLHLNPLITYNGLQKYSLHQHSFFCLYNLRLLIQTKRWMDVCCLCPTICKSKQRFSVELRSGSFFSILFRVVLLEQAWVSRSFLYFAPSIFPLTLLTQTDSRRLVGVRSRCSTKSLSLCKIWTASELHLKSTHASLWHSTQCCVSRGLLVNPVCWKQKDWPRLSHPIMSYVTYRVRGLYGSNHRDPARINGSSSISTALFFMTSAQLITFLHAEVIL